MTNFYFNLAEKLQGCSKQKGMVVCTSNPDGQPTVNRQSAMMLLRGKKAEKEQLSPTCLRSASDLPPFRSRYLRYAAMIFAVLVLSMANIGMAWGAYTPTADEVIILNSVYSSSATSSGYSTHSAIAWAGTASTNSMKAGDPSNNGVATSGNVACYSVKGNGKGKNITVSITGCSKIIVYHQSHSSRYVRLHENDKDGTVIGSGTANTYYTEVNLTPATTYTIFLEGWTGSEQTDFNVYAVKLIKASSCAAADLAAANITSNGDQIVGTGITFSKVGSPASGDTWYWQTSATGTDKTRNASSSYTTATTAGSYTVYLRAYNTAADCWGKAIGKTNTIISCPFDVYNGENVDKGNATASGWTINSSTNMAKTSGSSNGYSYWYQAGSASSYVQFDGSIALASGDQIKIQWTHTNGSNKTLQLTINGSSASLTSGSQANSSTLVEAVYDVTSAINVTSIKLNSSGSSGCIIYQVSIVKAACDDEPSCEAPSSVGISGTSSYLPGQNISLTAAATGGSGTPTTYQWYHRGVAIDGATSATYTKSNCTIDDAGNYTCKVTMGGSCSTTSPNFAVRVYSVKVWSNGGGSVIGNYPLTYQSSNNGRAVISTLSASTTYEFKVIDNVGGTSDSTIYYGNGGTIHHNTAIDPATWDFGSTTATNCKLVTGVETGDFTFDVDITHNGTGAGFYVTVNVAYPTKTIYLTPGVWNADGAKFAIHYYDANGGTGWTDFLTANDCGMSAEIPVWDGVKMIAGRFNSTKTSTGNWDDKWNQTDNITVSSYNSVVITGWNAGDYTYNSNFSTPTYTIGYAKGSVPTGGGSISGSKSNETKTCGVDFTLPSSAVFTTTGYTQVGWTTSDGGAQTHALGGSYTDNAAQTFYPVWEVAAVLTALECNTLYKVADMVPASITLTGDGQYGAGLSANTKFEVIGDPAEAGNAGGTPEMKNEAAEFASQSFAARMYLKGASNTTGSGTTFVPTSRAVKFIVGEAGTLDIYAHRVDRLYLKKAGDSGTTQLGTSTSGSGSKVSHSVTAGTYYIYATNNNTCIYGIQLNCCTTPAAPTAFSAGSITSTGATFSITDGGDAASYDIYYSESSTAPTESTAATTTSTEKTKAVTGLTAETDYYAWVRSVCDADHKSAWVALTSPTAKFTTSAAAASQTALVINTLYEVPDMIPSGATLTDDDQFFDGLSANTKFELIGSASSSTTPKANSKSTNDKTIDGITFDDGSMWFKGNASLTSNVPTTFGLSFIVPEGGGKLYLYFSGTSTNIKLAKSGASGSKPSCASGYGEVDVTAGTYYLYGTGETSPYCFYGLKLCSTYSVSITTNNTTKTSGETGSTAAVNGKAYTATFTANPGYTLPSDVTVSIGGAAQTKGTGYTWTVSSGTGTLTVPAAKVTGAISITVTGVAAESYSITYHCNDAESGCPSNVAAAYTLPSPLPTGLTKDGYDFGGWFTDAELTVPAVAGAALTGNTDLYAKWTERGSECEDTPHAWDVIATSAKSYKVRISKVTEEVAIPIADATASNLTAYAGTSSTSDNVTVQIADGGSSKYGYKFDGGNTYLKLVFSTPLVLNDTLVVGMTNASHNISFTTTAVRATTLSTSGGKLIIPAALAGQSTIYLWRGSGTTMYLRSFAVKHACDALPSCTTPTLPTLSNQSLCEGADIAAWDATPTNASTITAAGQSISYSWKKKGNDTELATTASFDLGSSAAESQAGTYVVTVTVSKTGYASATATKEVTLTVNEATEVTAITADKATVYPTNSVTLTATANMDADWQWYTCTNSAGDGEDDIDGATSASYTIPSAGAAGTYYYKAKATGDCGIGSMVYTLTVSAAAGGDCFHYVSVLPDKDISPSSGTSIVTPTYATTLEGGTMKVGSQQITITKNGLKLESSKSVSITLDNALEAGNVVIVKGTAATAGYGVTINGVNFYESGSKTFDVSYTVVADDGLEGKTALTVTKYSGSSYLQEIKITGCGVACTDPEVTASADNTTACVGTSVTFTATGAHASATYQWQKLDGTWTNISGATESTYNIASVVAGDAGKYRVIASHDCNRTSNEVTLSVPSVPNFGSTVPASVSVMQTIALSINTVEATDAVKYRWYKSADATWDAGDTEIGTNKELIKAYDSETIGSPSYYIFCRAQNACGITTSTAIAVNVTAYVEEDCATRGNEGDAAFSFENSGAGQGDYGGAKCWTMSSNSKILVYYPPTGKYFKTAKVTIASSSESKASYNWSTNGGTSFTAVSLTVNSTLTERTIDLSAHGNVNAFQIGRNFDSKGSSGGTLYVSKICFEYTDACTATTVTPSTSSVNYEMGDEWTDPTFTLTPAAVSGETLTYSSSNEDIASVDDDGTVTFNGEAGTVTITASYAGGTISETEYCASSGSYTINVSCPGGAPKVVASSSVEMSGCNSSVTLLAKTQTDGDFADGTYQWFRNGEEIDGATSSSYTATQAGTYTVERTNTSGCTTPSTNSAIVTSETTEPEVERLVPFQYYHVNKTYSEQMKMRHLFAVKNSGTLDGKHFKMYVSCNGGAATDVTSSNALVVVPNGDGHVDTVMVDLNKLSGKYNENDELVFTCKAIDCTPAVSEVYKNTITMNVIGATPTLALICSGSSKAEGTRKTSELTVGGDFLTGYNVADLCQQTGNTSFNANIEWGLYTDLKTQYIVTPVNGYAVFNRLNYEPFDILLLTDYPKASKSDAAADVLDDMAALCDYRPMLSFKTHMVAKSPSKWAAKGFTTSPVVSKADGRLNLNIVCYAHPMFASLTEGADVYKDNGDLSQLVYTMLSEPGYESSKGMQGFEIAAAENFVTIGLTHYNGTIAKNSPSPGKVTWTPSSEDRMLVTVAERQTNIEARFILFSLNCGAQSKLTAKGEEVILACLEYLLDDDPLHVADCALTFDNGAGNTTYDAGTYAGSGVKGDGKWSTEANWGPQYLNIPGEFNSARIAAPVTVDIEHAKAMELRIVNEGSINIPAGKGLEVTSTIRRMDGSEIYPTDVTDIHIGSASTGNGTLIFNNNAGDTKAHVDMYSTALADVANMSAATSTWQYIGTPHNDVASATRNYYDSWLYQYDTGSQDWTVIPNGGPLVPFRGYCVTHPAAPVVFDMVGTLVATTAQSIAVPAGYTVIANSWTAPIDISTFTDDDMENISDKTIYFFNTGTDVDGDHGTGTEAGTYVAVPKNSASYVGTWQIPSMQGFYISTTSDGTLHLDYDRHVRPTDSRSVVSNPMYAPRRAKAESDEPNVLKIFARGSRYQDKLVVLEREDFTRGYDSGWDGEAWGGGTLSPMVYVTGEGREDAVSAIPEFEGTVVAFKAGEDSEYRFEFVYSEDAEPLYLFDTENNTYTQIMTGNAYYFTTSDKAPHSRFILTRKAPQIATGTELTSDGEGANAKKLLIEDKMYILLNGMLYDATGKVVK